jgi:DNA repair and recombination protein RAD54B
MAQYAKRKKSGLASLGQWRHIDGLRPTARENVRDAVLRKLLHVPKPAQDKRATARTNSTSLLDAIDLDSVLAMDGEVDSSAVDVRSLSGGTISFLFEKGTEVAIEPESDDEPDDEGDDHASNSGSTIEI